MKKIIFALLALSFLFSCSSTDVVSSWKDPDTTIKADQIDKILFIALVKDETNRRLIENELAALSKGKGVASYSIIKNNNLTNNDKEKITAKLISDGFDLVVIMNLKDVKDESRYIPGNTGAGYGGRGYWGGYGYAAPRYYRPGYYVTDKNYIVETLIYSLVPEKLIWSGITSTLNPEKVNIVTTEISTAVIEQMKKDGFLVK